jgi:hypothetical protein
MDIVIIETNHYSLLLMLLLIIQTDYWRTSTTVDALESELCLLPGWNDFVC